MAMFAFRCQEAGGSRCQSNRDMEDTTWHAVVPLYTIHDDPDTNHGASATEFR